MTPTALGQQTCRAQSGRLLRCTPKAAEQFRSPLSGRQVDSSDGDTFGHGESSHYFVNASDISSSPTASGRGRRNRMKKRRSDIPITPLRKETEDITSGATPRRSAPISVLMLREAIVNKKSSILVLPYVAIVQEKIASLMVFEEAFGIRIEEYAANKGRIPPIKRRKDVSIYVATIEKANSLLNSFIETSELDRIGLVVVDELHMIGDGSRGTIIEQLLCKYLTKGFGQIIGMSATLSNIGELAGFLRAYVFSTTFRPVELHEFVRIGQTMWKVMPSGELELNAELPPNRLSKADPDGLCQLLIGVIPQRSVLIFCPTKKNCESVATLIAKCVPEEVRKRKLEEKKKVLAAMKEDCEGQVANSVDSLCEALTHSLLYAQVGYAAVRSAVVEAVEKLKAEALIVEDSEGTLTSSQLGAATFVANLSPLEAQRLATDLSASLNNGLVFSSHFHLLFTIAPYDAACAVDWDLFHTLYLALSDSEKKLLSSYGIPERVILQHIVKKKRLEAGDAAMRLYIGLLLQEIWKQQPHAAVAERFGVDRGWLQNTLQNATSQAAAIAKFSEKIPSLWPLRLLLPELVQRLSDCVVAELIPLMAIDGVKRGRARQLYAAGYKTVAKVAKANYKDLLKDIANLSRFNAIKMVNSAKTMFLFVGG
ncbi:hypothetical protein ANCCEY_11015 [Ancylostoma ceylanicum]|uniref:Helicase ATP-binding domain-containing protein n=1 Tax=Ancylostoma ceylanicum TaxID=53326 RepID=A0A0D6LDD7_9BILA|nr:hypothetical protein ANCCEY_11015 [Ancylostoma ceylanicum]